MFIVEFFLKQHLDSRLEMFRVELVLKLTAFSFNVRNVAVEFVLKLTAFRFKVNEQYFKFKCPPLRVFRN